MTIRQTMSAIHIQVPVGGDRNIDRMAKIKNVTYGESLPPR